MMSGRPASFDKKKLDDSDMIDVVCDVSFCDTQKMRRRHGAFVAVAAAAVAASIVAFALSAESQPTPVSISIQVNTLAVPDTSSESQEQNDQLPNLSLESYSSDGTLEPDYDLDLDHVHHVVSLEARSSLAGNDVVTDQRTNTPWRALGRATKRTRERLFRFFFMARSKLKLILLSFLRKMTFTETRNLFSRLHHVLSGSSEVPPVLDLSSIHSFFGDATADLGHEPRIGMTINPSSLLRLPMDLKCNPKVENGDLVPASSTTCGFSYEYRYELIEPLHLELGGVIRHAVDYLYRPVLSDRVEPVLIIPSLSLPGGQCGTGFSEDCSTKLPAATLTGSHVDQHVDSVAANSYFGICRNFTVSLEEVRTTRGWWNWWIDLTWRWGNEPAATRGPAESSVSMWNTPQGERDEEFYTTDGRGAFAGGSHGEIWRGRRLCGPNDENTQSTWCNRTLILKRLRIEKGYRVLEAGMREIVFGRSLSSLFGRGENSTADEASPAIPFSTYIDHFFRDGGASPFDSDRAERNRTAESPPELWIVFADAGRSLTSFLYTGVVVSDFIVFEPSRLWRDIRMSLSGSTALSLHALPVDIGSHELAIGSPDASSTSELPRRSKKGDGSSVCKESQGYRFVRDVLFQLVNATAALHKVGVVHRDIKPSKCTQCRAAYWLVA
jgi:hypothetical protein